MEETGVEVDKKHMEDGKKVEEDKSHKKDEEGIYVGDAEDHVSVSSAGVEVSSATPLKQDRYGFIIIPPDGKPGLVIFPPLMYVIYPFSIFKGRKKYLFLVRKINGSRKRNADINMIESRRKRGGGE